MKDFILHGFFILMANVPGYIALEGQQSIPFQTEERVILFSDRTLYVAGEQILFSAFIISGNEIQNEELSRILYCELITPEGDKIASSKYLIENSSASGYLTIPDYILTGNYYLRAYTKFMRNKGPYNYHYTLIKIVNPNRNEVQAANDNNNISENFSGERNKENTVNSFHISINKSKFVTRDTVEISIEGSESIQYSLKGLSLAVVPEFSNTANIVTLPGDEESGGGTAFYYPETRSLSITGKLTDNLTGNLLGGTKINLSIIGKGRDFMAIKTDSAGRFFFSLPDYIGSRDIFLCSENARSVDPKISVDNDFCTLPVHLPSNIFTLIQKEREEAYNMAVNFQLESFFKIDSIPNTGNNQHVDQAFYGKPDEVLYLNDYVQLPTLEEYFNELPTLVKVRKRQDKKYFKIIGPQTQLSDYEPLILVDLVAIDDPSKILALTPTSISSIEVVNVLYEKGDMIYGGIINFISKKNDFAGIDLPSSGIFINYGFLADSIPKQKINLLPHIPDTRNTLYWNPQFVLNKNNTANVSFTTSDTPGRYRVILNGIDLKGETFRQTATFEVLKN
jgi:hypothetical protein